VQAIVMRGYDRARQIIEAHSEAVQRIADELLVREVLDADQVRAIIAGRSLDVLEPVAPVTPAEPVVEEERRPRPAIVPTVPNSKPLAQE
jgi:cell division protease FtsH